jgi:hypothetical protein
MSMFRKNRSRHRHPLSHPVAILLLLAAAPSAAQMNIDSITITSGPSHTSGIFTDYFLDPELKGSGIASVRLTRQNGAFVDLVEDPPGTWACDEVIPSGPCENFPSLNAVRTLGDLTFTLTGTLGESDSATIAFADWDPGTGQPGIPTITAPTSGETGVSLTPTFTWNAAPTWVGAILAEIQIGATGDEVDSALLPETDTSWQPTGLPGGVNQEFRLSFFDVFFLDDPRSSTQMDAYLFSSAFESFNIVPLQTHANVPIFGGVGATRLVVGLIASGRSALRRRERT